MEADQRFFDHVFAQSGGFREILLSPTAFIDALTASYYELSPPQSGFEEVEIQDRPGYLSHLGFLAANAGSSYPNPIARGAAILRNVMCMDPSTLIEKPFPPPMALPPGTTNRQAVTSLTEAAACVTCHHVYVDPLGFAFEDYDAMGQHREIENGVAVDTVASYPFDSGLQTFQNSQELIGILADEPVVHRCYSAKMAEFVFARDLSSGDETTVAQAGSSRFQEDASMQELVLSLVTDPLFTHAQAAD